jgi:hypothetical protein
MRDWIKTSAKGSEGESVWNQIANGFKSVYQWFDEKIHNQVPAEVSLPEDPFEQKVALFMKRYPLPNLVAFGWDNQLKKWFGSQESNNKWNLFMDTILQQWMAYLFWCEQNILLKEAYDKKGKVFPLPNERLRTYPGTEEAVRTIMDVQQGSNDAIIVQNWYPNYGLFEKDRNPNTKKVAGIFHWFGPYLLADAVFGDGWLDVVVRTVNILWDTVKGYFYRAWKWIGDNAGSISLGLGAIAAIGIGGFLLLNSMSNKPSKSSFDVEMEVDNALKRRRIEQEIEEQVKKKLKS